MNAKYGYHLSFNGELEGKWIPRQPDGYDEQNNKDSTIGEPSVARISVAPTIEGCIRAIYPNVFRFFEKNNYPYIDMYVYSPEKLLKRDVVSTKELTTKRYVWDAHVTGEFWIIHPVVMKRIAKIRIMNPGKNNVMHTYPFNDKSVGELYDIRPAIVDYSVRELYIDEEVRMTSQETKLAALMTRLQSSQQMQEEMKKLIQEEAQAVLITPANYDEVDAAEFALAVHSMIKEPEKHVVIIAEEDDGVVYTDEQGPRVRQVSSILKEAGVTVYDSVDAFQEVIEGQTHVTGDDTTTVE
jgi:hypothetical protein